MKKVILLGVILLSAVLFTEHTHSFIVGFSLATIAVGVGYFIAYQAILQPHYVMTYLVCALMTKLVITIAGVIWVFSADIIHSPITFLVAYSLFSVMMTYLASKYHAYRKDKSEQTQHQLWQTGLYRE
ncbi:hypothetical protein I3260_10165 [Photobacterium damselae]|uniref:hypothetical protein n=1 Tax=Photobacterium damselae TaxID=38293 RepID=UPI001EDDB332|nr:hypothetical protein [Photobacterium damselae]MCG3812602.1 hypothetical protein [Photobacterium damselae]